MEYLKIVLHFSYIVMIKLKSNQTLSLSKAGADISFGETRQKNERKSCGNQLIMWLLNACQFGQTTIRIIK